MIKLISFETRPHHNPDNTQTLRDYGQIHIIDADGQVVAAPLVPIEDLPALIQPDDLLTLIKA